MSGQQEEERGSEDEAERQGRAARGKRQREEVEAQHQRDDMLVPVDEIVLVIS